MSASVKSEIFRGLHISGNPLVMPNAHDIGSAKMLVALGAQAVATTSAGYAFVLGKPDGAVVTRDEMLDHCEDMVRGVNVPVSADLENGYGHDPDSVAECVELAIETGLAGCCIEDSTFETAKPSYDFDVAVERIKAAVQVVQDKNPEFMLCARADGVMIQSYDSQEAIRRCQAFEEVGADVLYSPLLTMDDLKTLCQSVKAPVNALCVGNLVKLKKDDFAKIGVARISIGSALARVTHKFVNDIGKAIIENGDFSALALGMSGKKVDELMKKGEG